jgi:hypothetical protein
MHPQINAIHRSSISEEIQKKLDGQSDPPSAGRQYLFSTRPVVEIRFYGQ